MHLTLERYYTPDPRWGTFGRLLGDGLELVTVEQAWAGNAPRVSCIPEGEYDLVWRDSPKYGRRLHLVGGTVALTADAVERGEALRSHCLMHPANWARQLQGCIAPGLEFAVMDGLPAVTSSTVALVNLEAAVGQDGATLTIRPHRVEYP